MTNKMIMMKNTNPPTAPPIATPTDPDSLSLKEAEKF